MSIFFRVFNTSGVFVSIFEPFISISMVSRTFRLYEYAMENLDEKSFSEELNIQMLMNHGRIQQRRQI